MRSPAGHRDAAFGFKLIPGGRAWQRMSALAESLRWLGRRAEILDGCRAGADRFGLRDLIKAGPDAETQEEQLRVGIPAGG